MVSTINGIECEIFMVRKLHTSNLHNLRIASVASDGNSIVLHNVSSSSIEDYAKDGGPGRSELHVVLTIILCGTNCSPNFKAVWLEIANLLTFVLIQMRKDSW